MAYRLNAKNMAVTRLMPRGKQADKRLKYLHVSRKGSAVITPVYVCRVSLPFKDQQPTEPVIYPQGVIDSWCTEGQMPSTVPTLMPDGLPAVTSPEYLVPQIDKSIPEPSEQAFSFTVNGELLLKMLKVANDVNEDPEKTIRLRFCPDRGVMRMDTYRKPGGQEFLGVLRQVEYLGPDIPGDAKPDAIKNFGKHEEKPKQTLAALKVAEGRRFRG